MNKDSLNNLSLAIHKAMDAELDRPGCNDDWKGRLNSTKSAWIDVAARAALTFMADATIQAEQRPDIMLSCYIALDRLVQLKEYKKRNGVDAYYKKERPYAWGQAKAAIAAIGESVAQAGSIPASPATDTLIGCPHCPVSMCEAVENDYGRWQVFCGACGSATGTHKTREAAEAHWNKRVIRGEMLYTADRDEPLIDAVIAGAATWLVENKKQAIPRDIAYEIVRSLRPWLRYPARELSVEEKEKRRPSKPETLVGALQDSAHEASGKLISATPITQIEGGN